MSENPHFQSAASWEEAEELLTFTPRQPQHTAGLDLQSLSVYVRDHKMRELAVADRSLEADYDGFVVSQSRKEGAGEARRQALDVSYGRAPYPARIAGHEGRAYELGPEPPPDDIDGRSPAVVVWSDGDVFYLVASTQLSVDELMAIAASIHSPTAA